MHAIDVTSSCLLGSMLIAEASRVHCSCPRFGHSLFWLPLSLVCDGKRPFMVVGVVRQYTYQGLRPPVHVIVLEHEPLHAGQVPVLLCVNEEIERRFTSA